MKKLIRVYIIKFYNIDDYLLLETTTISFDPETDKQLLQNWVKILFEYCNFQFINDVRYLSSIIQVAKILSVYHQQNSPNKTFLLKNLHISVTLDQVLDIIRTLEDNNDYFQSLL